MKKFTEELLKESALAEDGSINSDIPSLFKVFNKCFGLQGLLPTLKIESSRYLPKTVVILRYQMKNLVHFWTIYWWESIIFIQSRVIAQLIKVSFQSIDWKNNEKKLIYRNSKKYLFYWWPLKGALKGQPVWNKIVPGIWDHCLVTWRKISK